MAINTEIDELLVKAAAQGITVGQAIVQLQQRYDDTANSDTNAAVSMSTYISDADWLVMRAWLAGTSTTMPFAIAWSRLWSAAVSNLQDAFLLEMFQLVRVLNRDNSSNVTLPNMGSKSGTLYGHTWFNF